MNLVPLNKDEKVRAILPIEDMESGESVVFATRNGRIKKTALDSFKTCFLEESSQSNSREMTSCRFDLWAKASTFSSQPASDSPFVSKNRMLV